MHLFEVLRRPRGGGRGGAIIAVNFDIITTTIETGCNIATRLYCCFSVYISLFYISAYNSETYDIVTTIGLLVTAV